MLLHELPPIESGVLLFAEALRFLMQQKYSSRKLVSSSGLPPYKSVVVSERALEPVTEPASGGAVGSGSGFSELSGVDLPVQQATMMSIIMYGKLLVFIFASFLIQISNLSYFTSLRRRSARSCRPRSSVSSSVRSKASFARLWSPRNW